MLIFRIEMSFYSQSLYKEFEKELKRNIEASSNMLIVTIPGLGASYFIRKFLEKHSKLKIAYVDGNNDTLDVYNVLDLNFDKNEQAGTTVDSYFRSASLNQKFAVVVNIPYILETQAFKSSFWSSHIYSTYYFGARDNDDSDIFALEINSKLTKDELVKISDLSAGIGRLIKFFAINTIYLNDKLENLLSNETFLNVFEPTIRVVEKCNNAILAKMKIVDGSVYRSMLIKKYFEQQPKSEEFQIEINTDLSFSEEGQLAKAKLLKLEMQVLENAMENNGVVTKEKVADLKWGEGSYDDYSDQAIGKTIQRLRKKLKVYDFEAIPQVGYKLIKK